MAPGPPASPIARRGRAPGQGEGRGHSVRRRLQLAATPDAVRHRTRRAPALAGHRSVSALPGVGQNLQDHLDFIYTAKTRDTDVLGLGRLGPTSFSATSCDWRRDGSGLSPRREPKLAPSSNRIRNCPGPTCSCISSARWLTIIRANCIGATAIHAMSAF
jgi:hypothetical protein